MRFSSRAVLALVLSTALATPMLVAPVLAQTIATDPLIAIDAEQIPGDFSTAIADAAPGRTLFLAGEYVTALAMLRPLADAGNPVAQNILGVSLTERNGAYGTYDAAEGFRYLLAAGAQNFGPAMQNLGDTYDETHDGFAPNIEESSRWFIAAAELGYEPAFNGAAFALVYGHGVAEDGAAGRIFLDRALNGDYRAYTLGLLGDLAYFGQGQAQDLVLSLEYYLQAAEAGNAEAAWYAAFQYMSGEGALINPAAALPLLEQAVAGNELDAIGHLSLLLSSGEADVVPDPDRAFALAMGGDEMGNGFASSVLGDFYRLGVGTEENFDLARAAYERGQERGEAEAIYQLGDMAYFGLGDPANYELAFAYYHGALEIYPDHRDSLYSIAYMQMRGEGTEVDIASATDLLQQTIEQRHLPSMIEAVELFGAPEYRGPQTDEVRARAHCLYVDALGRLPMDDGDNIDTGDIEDHVATCTRLAEELSAEDQTRAAEMAAAMAAAL